MPRCVLQAIPLGQRKLSKKGNLFFHMVLTNAWQVESSSHAQQNTTLPRTLKQTCSLAVALGQQQSHFDTNMLIRFSSRGLSKFRFLKGFTFITPQDSMDKMFAGYKMEHLPTNHHHSGDL